VAPADRPPDASVQSVDRAISILELLAHLGAGGVTEIGAELGLSKSTVFRLLGTLEARGLVEQSAERGKYRVGHTVVQLAAGASPARDIAEISRPVTQELARVVGETINIAIHDGRQVITVGQAQGDAAVSASDSVGNRGPLHATAAGKVFLAEMSEAELASVLEDGLVSYTPRTVTDAADLSAELARVRTDGFGVTREEHEWGLVAGAVPIRTLGGRVVAALVVSGPTYRVNDETLPALMAQLHLGAAKISWRAGYPKHG
jgi:IclR family acetate operon transcriptional repressor